MQSKIKIPNEIPIVFHNGSKHDFHFIIKELVKGTDGIRCLGEDKEKYITFKVPMKKKNKPGQLITIKLKFMDSFRFMNRSLSDLVYNLSEINKQECVKCKEEKNESVKCKYVRYVNNRMIYKCKG